MNEGLSLEEAEKRLQWYDKKYGPYIDKKGLHNFKNLFRRPTMYEWVILFMLLLTLFLSWAYAEDTKVCREFVSKSIAENTGIQKAINSTEYVPINLTLNNQLLNND